MKTFYEFLKEAYSMPNRSGNWNVLPTAQKTAQPLSIPAGEVTYHKDVGLPKEFEKPSPGMFLRYGGHSQERAAEKGLRLPARLPSEFQLIEVTMLKYRVIKWTIRFPLTSEWDIVLVVTPDGFVKTAWPNAANDLHRTLDRSKYALPAF